MSSPILSFLRLWMQVFVLLSLIFGSGATFVNVTVDDTLGDLQTGRKPIFIGAWLSSSNCTFNNTLCDLGLDGSKLQNDTWTGSTSDSSSVTILFNGSAIYAFFVIPSNIFTTEITYSLDDTTKGAVERSFTLNPAAFQYNTPLISLLNLSDAQHNLTIVVGAAKGGLLRSRQSNFGAIFDYALYTTSTTNKKLGIKSAFLTATQPSSITKTSSPSSTVKEETSSAVWGNSKPFVTADIELTVGSQTPISTQSTSHINQVISPSSTPGSSTSERFSSPAALAGTNVANDVPMPTSSAETQASNADTSLNGPESASMKPTGADSTIFPPDTTVPNSDPTIAPNPAQGTKTIVIPTVSTPTSSDTDVPSLPSQTSSPSVGPTSHNKHALAGIIGGGIIGGIVCLFLLLWVFLCLRRMDFFARFLPMRLVRVRSIDTINSFVTREFPPLPTEAPRKNLYTGQDRVRRSSSVERLISPRIITNAKTRYNSGRFVTTDPVRERLLTEQPSDCPPSLPYQGRLRPLTLLSSISSVSSMSPIDYQQNSNLEPDYQRRINALEAEVQRLQSERDYLAHLTFNEELPDYSDLNSPRNSSRYSPRHNV